MIKYNRRSIRGHQVLQDVSASTGHSTPHLLLLVVAARATMCKYKG